jgi:uncharacterized membrane protein (DUF373 family)
MKYYKQLKKFYSITENDIENIKFLKPVMEKYKSEFIAMFEELLNTIYKYPEDVSIEVKIEHSKKMGIWYDLFFSGNLNNDYISFLSKIGIVHYEFKINPSYVSGAFSHIRRWLHEKIFQNFEDDVKRKELLVTVHKLLDLNYEILSSSYNEEYLKNYSSIFSTKNLVIGVTERFSTFMHILLSGVLMLLVIGATIMFGNEMFGMLSKHSSHILISSLGSLLIIWVLLELLHTEIQMIKGGKFKISVFIGVAMVAFVRDLLILTLKHEPNSHFSYFFLASIIGLGVIYWLVTYTEKTEFRRTK